MAKTVTSSRLRVGVALTALALLSSSSAGAASLGSLRGIVQNEAGRPLPNILVTILDPSSEQAIPILTRTNELGHLFVSNIEAGAYQVAVKSSDYRTAGDSAVEVLPGKTSLIKLVLQELLNAEGDSENIAIKSLLRTPTDRRLIFREQPGQAGELALETSPLFDNAVFQVYTNAGFGDDYLIYPGDSIHGTSTNFAFVESFIGNSKYILAGQLNSGEDSLWRLKNIYQYDLGDLQSLTIYMGYGRMSFQQPSLSLLGNPVTLGNEVDYVRALGTTKTFNFGFEDRLNLGTVSILWGLEFNQVRNHHRADSFWNPNFGIAYTVTPNMVLDFRASSKRTTLANTVNLPDGQIVNLDDSMHYARIGDQLTFGTTRYYQASLARKIGGSSEIEIAGFATRRMGGTLPFLAVFEFSPAYDIIHIEDEQAGTRGYRMTWNQQFSPTLRGSISFVRANALGLPTYVTSLMDGANMGTIFGRGTYHSVTAQLDTRIPQSGTTITALVRVVPDGRPLTTLDAFSDLYETGNQGINLFVRQTIPVPVALLQFVGLDFLAVPRLEALLDFRNIIDQNLGKLTSSQGQVILVRAPRSVRGGISFKF
ncbi:MAG TPA: carboxypeptidase-like regulatory domain-containing protein [Acidobacteriota bacterium]|nr:carboxypeptidase-like regulatory domain-containing protein [Acidobacteriota bacterium]